MCGIVGVWGAENASEIVYLALHALQHRGQEHCGIVSRDGKKFNNRIKEGLVTQAFGKEDLDGLGGKSAVGHVRYTTQGGSSLLNAQPFLVQDMALVHNGEFANCKKVRREMENNGSLFRTESDTEILLHNFAASQNGTIEDRISDAFSNLSPAYSVIMLTKREMVGIRDPSGVRPLEIGVMNGNGGFVLASESVALDKIGAERLGEVERGEAVIVDKKGLRKERIFEPGRSLPCIFEHVYLGHPCSKQFGSDFSNGIIRREFGRQLWREHPAEVDFIVSVPDSGNALASGYSAESGIPLGPGIVRSHYVGRTFIEPTQSRREGSVLRKYDFDDSVLKGKRIALLDDSIVRGTTIRRLIKQVRDFGAREVHVRIGSPPYRHGCYLGIDTPNKEHLIAHRFGEKRIAREIGADSLGYLSEEGMLANTFLAQEGYCTQCFDGVVQIPQG